MVGGYSIQLILDIGYPPNLERFLLIYALICYAIGSYSVPEKTTAPIYNSGQTARSGRIGKQLFSIMIYSDTVASRFDTERAILSAADPGSGLMASGYINVFHAGIFKSNLLKTITKSYSPRVLDCRRY